VTGGSFLRSYDAVSYTDSGYPATVADFRLDSYEVSVARFREFVIGRGTSEPARCGSVKSGTNSGWSAGWNRLAVNTQSLKSLPAATPATERSRPSGRTTRPSAPSGTRLVLHLGCWKDRRKPSGTAPQVAEQRVYPWSAPPTLSSVDELRELLRRRREAVLR
jgi:hypothetical protein